MNFKGDPSLNTEKNLLLYQNKSLQSLVVVMYSAQLQVWVKNGFAVNPTCLQVTDMIKCG